jgi:exodeoxyribonuclease-3
MKMVSWNVNGVRAAAKKGFLEWMGSVDADLVFLQETKAELEQLPREVLAPPGGWTGHAFHSGSKRGYSGVAVYWKRPPDEIYEGLGIDEFDAEGRVIGVRYGDVVIYGNYFPNGGQGPERVDYKLRFYDAMLARMKELRRQGRHCIVTGDYNTAHQDVDLARPKQNSGVSGFLPEERVWIDRYLDEGWVDTFRLLHPDATDRYSWWSWRQNAKAKNLGWRIDYWMVPSALAEGVRTADIDPAPDASDHAPVSLDLAW